MTDDAETPSLSAARRIAHVAPLTTLREKVLHPHGADHRRHAERFLRDRRLRGEGRTRRVSCPGDGEAVARAYRARASTPASWWCSCAVHIQPTTIDTCRTSGWSRRPAARATATPWHRVCQEGTRGGDYYGDVRPVAGDIIVTKHRYSAFHGTELKVILRSHGVRTVVLTSVSTQCASRPRLERHSCAITNGGRRRRLGGLFAAGA